MQKFGLWVEPRQVFNFVSHFLKKGGLILALE